MTTAGPTLFTTAATARALERARAIVVLIGSYDGSGNYGDIAQFAAALALVERLHLSVLALPVLEREYLAGHWELAGTAGVSAPNAVFFDPDGGREGDDLMPVGAPADLAFGACYLYGGGYLNRLWGPRKLAMLAAAEALLAAGGAERIDRVSSGLQVEPEWIAEGNAPALEHFDLLGARDDASQRALAAIDANATTLETGDDAIGLLGRLPLADAAPTLEGTLHLNLHFAEHDWVSAQPQALLDFYAAFVAELGRQAGAPVRAQPLIAYRDGRVDESAAAARLREACSALGVETAEPLVLRPAGLAAAAPELGRASLTLSCSYHVAMTSLMLGVPAVLIGDNPYYEQKAAGLCTDFGLPSTFRSSAASDPVARARELAAPLFDPKAAEGLRQELAAGAEKQRRRRDSAELELLGRLGAAATTGLALRLGEQSERLRQRSAEPAELRVQLAALESELEQARDSAGGLPLAAELRAQEAKASAAEAQRALAEVLESRSWRLLAPLRRLAALLRRR